MGRGIGAGLLSRLRDVLLGHGGFGLGGVTVIGVRVVGVEKDVLSFLQIWVTLTPGGEWAATVPPSTTSRPQMV